MKKIPTVFIRDWSGDRSRVLNQVNPGCEWVLDGEGVARWKIDGTCCLMRNGKLFKRREIKRGDSMPSGFEPCGIDDETGKKTGWIPVGEGDEDKWHREGLLSCCGEDGTYELCGPKVQGNPEGFLTHVLVSHLDAQVFPDCPRTYDEIRNWLSLQNIEGIVFHHTDGRMAKIKLRDFGLRRRLTS